MKNKPLIIALFVVFTIILILGGSFFASRTVDMKYSNEGEAIFRYGDDSISHILLPQELIIIESIFDGKRLYKDSPSCGFTENVCIKFNDSQSFCFACDDCPIVYWKEKDMYFSITEEEKAQLYDALGKYGFYFPCV